MATQYSTSFGGALNSAVSIDNSRQMFNFGDRVAELAVHESPFLAYLSKVAKRSVDSPVFKFLEQRHQWQRRNFESNQAVSTNDLTSDATLASLRLSCLYDKYGRPSSTDKTPIFFLVDQKIALAATDASDSTAIVLRGYISAVNSAVEGNLYADVDFEVTSVSKNGTVTAASGGTVAGFSDVDIADGDKGQIIGSAFAEGSTAPDGWIDYLFDREGYCQIFKTAIPLFSGTSMSTRYRGRADEMKRAWAMKLKEHKMDLEEAALLEVGRSDEGASGPTRYTWGILPYTEAYGKVYNFSYSTSGYDDFLDSSEDFFAPEGGNSGDKLVLTSRKIITWLNKLQDNSFLKNTVGASQYRLDVQNIKGRFGHRVTMVDAFYGRYHFVMEPKLRGPWEDYAVCVDMAHVAWRPLVANGRSRDTHIITNVQNNDVDGRKDIILTEAGLEISNPETHAIMKWAT